MTTIDLNADLGEGAGTDAELLQIVSSASIACGGHAGDAETMRTALRMAGSRGVRCGAHPGFADPEHFGRRRLNLPASELAAQIRAQLTVIRGIAAEEGVPLAYVKLHGALANMAAEDEEIAATAFRVVAELLPGVAILAIDNSAQIRAAGALGLAVIREAYADRRYTPGGLLLSRTLPDAVIADAAEVTAQCLRLAQKGEIVAHDGTRIASQAASICLHGDTPGAVELARSVRNALEDAGISVQPGSVT